MGLWEAGGCVVEQVDCGVESSLAASIGFMVRLGRRGPDQLFEVVLGGGQDGPVVMGADAEDESFAVRVQQLQVAQCCGGLVGDGDVVGGLREGEASAPQIERRVLPVS